jgi:hypothetical protein
MKITKYTSIVAMTLVAAGSSEAAASSSAIGTVVASNLDEPVAGLYGGFGPLQGIAANSFTTGSHDATLKSATLLLFSQNHLPPPAEYVLRLYQDTGGRPGELLATFNNMPTTTSEMPQRRTFFTATPLTADTKYWLGVLVTPTSSFGAWKAVQGPGAGPWTIGARSFSHDGGATWRDEESAVGLYGFALSIQVPEPASGALTSLCLGGLYTLNRDWPQKHFQFRSRTAMERYGNLTPST